MKVIVYAGDELITGDAIALATLRYSGALAAANTADTVEIPVLHSDGSRGSVTLLVGPASQIIAKDLEHGDIDLDGAELVDDQLVEQLHAKTRELSPTAHAETPEPSAPWLDEL